MLNVNLSQFGVLFSPKIVSQNTLVAIMESLPYLLGKTSSLDEQQDISKQLNSKQLKKKNNIEKETRHALSLSAETSCISQVLVATRKGDAEPLKVAPLTLGGTSEQGFQHLPQESAWS